MDPRRDVVAKRLEGARRIVAFCSAKGGVGKTFCASVSALILSGRGRATGLLDLDFQGASTHLVLGVHPGLPEEREGILPFRTPEGVSLMTVTAFSGERALPLRGRDVTHAILELLAVTVWGELDFLLVDLPPGIGDEVLDLVTLVPRLEAIVVSTPSPMSVSVVDRLLGVLRETRVKVAGVLANMSRGDSTSVESLAGRHGVPFAGDVPFDPEVEKYLGLPGKLLESAASKGLGLALEKAGLLP